MITQTLYAYCTSQSITQPPCSQDVVWCESRTLSHGTDGCRVPVRKNPLKQLFFTITGENKLVFPYTKPVCGIGAININPLTLHTLLCYALVALIV